MSRADAAKVAAALERLPGDVSSYVREGQGFDYAYFQDRTWFPLRMPGWSDFTDVVISVTIPAFRKIDVKDCGVAYQTFKDMKHVDKRLRVVRSQGEADGHCRVVGEPFRPYLFRGKDHNWVMSAIAWVDSEVLAVLIDHEAEDKEAGEQAILRARAYLVPSNFHRDPRSQELLAEVAAAEPKSRVAKALAKMGRQSERERGSMRGVPAIKPRTKK